MDAYIKNVVVGLVPAGDVGSSTITDQSPTNRALTNNGVVISNISTAQYSGRAMRFNGSADIEVPSSPDLDLGNYYTVECGFMADTIENWFGLVQRGYYSAYTNDWTGLVFSIVHTGNGNLVAYFWGTTVFNERAIVSSTPIEANRHYTLAVVRSGTNGYMLLDGAVVGTISNLQTCAASNLPLRIGHYDEPYVNNGRLVGYIDNVRITKGVPRWTAAYTPDLPFEFTQPVAGSVTTNGLRMGAVDQGYFLRLITNPGGGKKLTLSAWIALDTANMEAFFYGSRSSSSSYDLTAISVRGAQFTAFSRDSNLNTLINVSASELDLPVGVERHVTIVIDTTQPAPENRVQIYIGATRATLAGTFPAQDAVLPLLQAGQTEYIGVNWGNAEYAHGLLGGLAIVDGTAATPSQFTGAYGAYTGGSYGPNGGFLAFLDTSGNTVNSNVGFGADSSGLDLYRPSYGIALANAISLSSLPTPLSVSGVVRDANNQFAARTIVVQRRDNSQLLGSTVSDAATGAYSVSLTYSGLVDIIAKDSTGTLPDLILSRVTPG
ncbi:hypothetical protein PSQ40_04940 [Curvibacter sp. HBC61]|uniref:LamG-like jellyroll fold domain-containing protein n=1 Tax=Curvibacter cyanobacteriorum TaxID=3026422 RepID=A0ABT5MV36_9BURK|nr:LamG-like jellyroll fold domain-containing protein [Curvibacter sp. HBC61]MDD0837912.1 hypothetical protein [Curvibacter sp. HBC61]